MTDRHPAHSTITGVDGSSAPPGNGTAGGHRRLGEDRTGPDGTSLALLPEIASGSFQAGDYDYEQGADVALLDLLFADMGVSDGELGPARTWASRQIEYQRKVSSDVYTMGALQRDLWFWLGGYGQALVDLGLREPDNCNTFPS